MTYELRQYQQTLVDGCRSALSSGYNRIIAYLPTGGGKTSVATAIIEMCRSKGKRVAFVCNRLQLIQQTSSVFDREGIRYGVIQGSNTCDPWASVLLCSIQTVAKRGLPNVDLIIIDEAHGAAGTLAYHEIMQGKRVIGLTATPYQKGLGKVYAELGGPLFETVVVGSSMRDLQEQGYLVHADVWAPADPDLSGVRVVAGDYQEDQLGEAMDKPNLVGDAVEHWFRHANNKQTMVFCVTIPHSKHVCEQFVKAGVNAVHVDYRMSDDEKKTIYADFRASNTMVLCNCALLSEGADFPACEALVLLRPTKSPVRFVQMFGRALRPSEGKDRAIILDHSGSTKRIGFPWDLSVTHLDDGKPKKSKSEKPDRPAPLPKACPQCHFVKPPGQSKCSSCGFETRKPVEIDVAEGQLVPITPKAKLRGIPALEDIGRSSVYHQLLYICDKRGYSEGWAANKYNEAFGCWPNGITKNREEACGTVLSWEQSRRIAWAKLKRSKP